jgi:hypothetical protein
LWPFTANGFLRAFVKKEHVGVKRAALVDSICSENLEGGRHRGLKEEKEGIQVTKSWYCVLPLKLIQVQSRRPIRRKKKAEEGVRGRKRTGKVPPSRAGARRVTCFAMAWLF